MLKMPQIQLQNILKRPILRTRARQLYCSCARAGGVRHRKYHVVVLLGACTVNQQILAAINLAFLKKK